MQIFSKLYGQYLHIFCLTRVKSNSPHSPSVWFKQWITTTAWFLHTTFNCLKQICLSFLPPNLSQKTEYWPWKQLIGIVCDLGEKKRNKKVRKKRMTKGFRQKHCRHSHVTWSIWPRATEIELVGVSSQQPTGQPNGTPRYHDTILRRKWWRGRFNVGVR